GGGDGDAGDAGRAAQQPVGVTAVSPEAHGRSDLPTGTVTFLFTDIEGSTRLAQTTDVATFRDILERHNAVIRAACAAHGGVERGTEGDAFLEIFTDAGEAVAAAVAAQRALAEVEWPGGVDLRVRMGLHRRAAYRFPAVAVARRATRQPASPVDELHRARPRAERDRGAPGRSPAGHDYGSRRYREDEPRPGRRRRRDRGVSGRRLVRPAR